jgi:putative membrane protein
MIRAALLLGLIGLACATVLFVREGFTAILAAFAAAGWGILWTSLFHVVPMGLNARAWQLLLPPRRRPSWLYFGWCVWVREAVNGLLPVARIGGEVVSARLLMHRGVHPAPAVATLVVDVTVSLVSQASFTLLGLALAALAEIDEGFLIDIAVGLVAALPVMAAAAFAQKFGLFGIFARIFRALFSVFGDRFAGMVGGAAMLDRAVRRLYRRMSSVFACGLWQLAGWVAGAGEIWIALYFLKSPIDFNSAIIIEALVQAVGSTAFVIPGALGVQEGSFLLIGGMLGLPADIALALALTRRARDVIVFVPALAAWQYSVGRRLVSRGRHA